MIFFIAKHFIFYLYCSKVKINLQYGMSRKKAPLLHAQSSSIRDARSQKKGSGEVVDLSILHEGD
jgi:hypothetical protein